MRLHLRSDVPVAFALSGVIDSSAISMASRRYAFGDLHAFCSIAAEPTPSEGRQVDCAVAAASLVSHKVHVKAKDLAADLQGLVAQ